MDAQEANALIAKAGLTDPRLRFNTPQEQSARATAWAELLEDVFLDEALRALHTHQRTSTYPPLPVNILTLVQAERRQVERAERVRLQLEARAEVKPDLTAEDKAEADRVYQRALAEARAGRVSA